VFSGETTHTSTNFIVFSLTRGEHAKKSLKIPKE